MLAPPSSEISPDVLLLVAVSERDSHVVDFRSWVGKTPPPHSYQLTALSLGQNEIKTPLRVVY